MPKIRCSCCPEETEGRFSLAASSNGWSSLVTGGRSYRLCDYCTRVLLFQIRTGRLAMENEPPVDYPWQEPAEDDAFNASEQGVA